MHWLWDNKPSNHLYCRNSSHVPYVYSLGLHSRMFLVDMAGVAIHLCQFFKHPNARVGVNVHGTSSWAGFLETDLLEHFTSRSAVECRGSETEVYCQWDTASLEPLLEIYKKHVMGVLVCTIGKIAMIHCNCCCIHIHSTCVFTGICLALSHLNSTSIKRERTTSTKICWNITVRAIPQSTRDTQ